MTKRIFSLQIGMDLIRQLQQWKYMRKRINTIHMYSEITSGRVLSGELLYTEILEVHLFAYRLFHEEFSSRRLKRKLHETVCRQMQTN